MLKVNAISKTFNPGTVNEKKALSALSLHLEAGDFVTVIGSNGAGKSTLLNAVAGVFYVDEGRIVLGGRDITFLPEHRRSQGIGRLFQDPLKGTAPNMTIEENLALAYLRSAKGNPFSRISQKDKALFRERLALLGMGLEDRMSQPVGVLSGGQRQALTLLMATLVPPQLLLLDEHTAALDPATADKGAGAYPPGGRPGEDYLPDGHPQYASGSDPGESYFDDGRRQDRAGRVRRGALGHDGGRPAAEVPGGNWPGAGQRPDAAV